MEATLAPGITGYGIEFCGTKCKLFIDRSRYEDKAVGRGEKPVEVKGPDHFTLDHVKIFLECVKTRKKPAAREGKVLYERAA